MTADSSEPVEPMCAYKTSFQMREMLHHFFFSNYVATLLNYITALEDGKIPDLIRHCMASVFLIILIYFIIYIFICLFCIYIKCKVGKSESEARNIFGRLFQWKFVSLD